MKYPIALPYIRTLDQGQELRYSIRSYQNITNWDGDIMVLGDREKWFKNITHIPMQRRYNKIYLDQVLKMRRACDLMPEKFIASMDDLYITEKTEVDVYCQGLLTGDGRGIHKRTKATTKEVLEGMGIENPIDYEVHMPILVERDKLKQTLDLIISHPQAQLLQWRSMYGNLNNIPGVYVEDAKTKNGKLPEGPIISTNFYTPELQKLFGSPSIFEGDKV